MIKTYSLFFFFFCTKSVILCRNRKKDKNSNFSSMIEQIILVATSFVVAVMLGILLIPGILMVAFDKNLFDLPNERKVHDSPVPRLGGVSFFPVIVFCMFVACLFLLRCPYCSGFFSAGIIPEMLALVAGLTLLYMIGIGDDLVGLHYSRKFLVQIVSALLIPAAGLYINNFYGLFGIGEIPSCIGVPLTVFLVVFITNSINLIDGIDGLASGLSIVALVMFGITFAIENLWIYTLLAFICVGVLIPFFFYNVFGSAEKHHKIFMGDTGSLTLGFILSLMAIKYSMFNGAANESVDGAPLLTAFSMLLVPCLDVVRVVVRRLQRKAHPFKPDRTHLHHKFLLMGIKPRLSMILILLMAAGYIAMTYTLINVGISANVVFVFILLIWVVSNIWFSIVIRRRN